MQASSTESETMLTCVSLGSGIEAALEICDAMSTRERGDVRAASIAALSPTSFGILIRTLQILLRRTEPKPGHVLSDSFATEFSFEDDNYFHFEDGSQTGFDLMTLNVFFFLFFPFFTVYFASVNLSQCFWCVTVVSVEGVWVKKDLDGENRRRPA